MAESIPESASEVAEDAAIAGEEAPAGFPPYPPYTSERAPPSVADTIIAGRDLRVQHKAIVKRSVRPIPKPARPRGPKATDIKLSKRAARRHARCLRQHGTVLSDRLEFMSKPPRRCILFLWRQYANILPPETAPKLVDRFEKFLPLEVDIIPDEHRLFFGKMLRSYGKTGNKAIIRLRAMLDADEPFKPEQAYEYFVNLRKMKKTIAKTRGVHQIKKELDELCTEKRFMWARNATVAFARGLQQRLTRPGVYALTDGMLRLSDIILEEVCGFMHIRRPSRRCRYPKSKFIVEMADKVAVWINEIMLESEDRMLMMDFDEDEDVFAIGQAGDMFTEDFLDMMGDGGLLIEPQSAYLKFTGDMLDAFMILTDSMYARGEAELLSYGKFNQTYKEAADELKETDNFHATEFDTALSTKIIGDLNNIVNANTPGHLKNAMGQIIEICSKFLAQQAEFNKDKGPAFQLLVKAMRTRNNEQLFQKGKVKRTYGKAATDLEKARGLESDHDDPNISQETHSKLNKLTSTGTPENLKADMAETLDTCSKYLSQMAIDELERGPAFDLLIKELESDAGEPFTPEFRPLANKHDTAYALKSAPGLSAVTPDPSTSPTFVKALHKAVDLVTPKSLTRDMQEVIQRCGNYLSAYVRDRDKAMETVIQMMKKNPKKELVTRVNYTLDYGTGANEVENAQTITPFLPIKDIKVEAKSKLNKEMEVITPPALKLAVKSVVQDISGYLSQPVALRSGVAGKRYPLELLAAAKKTLGTRPLFKYKAFAQTYSDAADVLQYAGNLEHDPKNENLQHKIAMEMSRGIPVKVGTSLMSNLVDTMDDASKHLAKHGAEKGNALQHLVESMKGQGDVPLAQLQGYQQTYQDAARRIENASSLKSEKVDKNAYESVRGKLTDLSQKNPAPEHAKHMPGLVDETSKFLAAPFPENELDKRRVLADLMSREGDKILGEQNVYKLTYREAGEEIIKAPLGALEAKNIQSKKQIHDKISDVIPEKKLQNTLKSTVNEASSHLSNVIKGRGEVMQAIHDKMKVEKDNHFFTVGKFSKTHAQAAEMLATAPKFGGMDPSPVLVEKVADRVKNFNVSNVSNETKPYVPGTQDIVTKYIAGVATEESGLDAKAIREMDDKMFNTNVTRSTSNVEVEVDGREEYGDGSDASAFMHDDENLKRSMSTTAAVVEADGREKYEGDLDGENFKRSESTLTADQTGITEEEKPKESDNDRAQAIKADADAERREALNILHSQLRARGAETFYKQPRFELSHAQASDWLSQPHDVNKSVKSSGDTSRLHKKFEKKIGNLVEKKYSASLSDAMQDVIIESARILSEQFVASNYKALVRLLIISAMQRRGIEILIKLDNVAETYLFAAQRLKKATTLEVNEPCTKISNILAKKLDDILRCRTMPRKLVNAMKEHTKEAADYLSAVVTTPDEEIEAYTSLIREMEMAGDGLLVEGDIPKSYNDAALYLRQLTTNQDEISIPDGSLQSAIEKKLQSLMSTATPVGYSQPVLKSVISQVTKLLVSYIKLQGQRTEALKCLIEHMDEMGNGVLLRHGNVHKTYIDGANLLRPKNTDQLGVSGGDPVATRKIQIKLDHLMETITPDKYKHVMTDVIEDVTSYLAVYLLKPKIIQVCKCMKSVFVQCELWCEDILRRVERPCCTCGRHITAQAQSDISPSEHVTIPGSTRAFAPVVDVSITPCPAHISKVQGQYKSKECSSKNPTDECKHNTTLLYSTVQPQSHIFDPSQKTLPSRTSLETLKSSSSSSMNSELRASLVSSKTDSNFRTPASKTELSIRDEQSQPSNSGSLHNNDNIPEPGKGPPFWQSKDLMYTKIYLENEYFSTPLGNSPGTSMKPNLGMAKGKHDTTRAPIITTDQMTDWQAMMTSLMWNIQAWRDWIQEMLNQTLVFKFQQNTSGGEFNDTWSKFQRKMTIEAFQWRQYNNFSRQLILRLSLRYRDRKIVSPTRATVKTQIYLNCQQEMLDIIEMFKRWTLWVIALLKETEAVQPRDDTDMPLNELRWKYFKRKVDEHFDDWTKYNSYLNAFWMNKYQAIFVEWLPNQNVKVPVWVVSACGAVPSGAVAAGVFEDEVTWLARTTHRRAVLPAALHPSERCCVVYADGARYHYTKYQVLCNANVKWVACRAGAVPGSRAVTVSRDVLIGRVLYLGSHLVGAVRAPSYRCHVVIFGRPFAFNCYELLVISDND